MKKLLFIASIFILFLTGCSKNKESYQYANEDYTFFIYDLYKEDILGNIEYCDLLNETDIYNSESAQLAYICGNRMLGKKNLLENENFQEFIISVYKFNDKFINLSDERDTKEAGLLLNNITMKTLGIYFNKQKLDLFVDRIFEIGEDDTYKKRTKECKKIFSNKDFAENDFKDCATKFIATFVDISSSYIPNIKQEDVKKDNNTIIIEGKYNSKGKRIGTWMTMAADGSIRDKGKYNNDIKEGIWIETDLLGTKWEGEYINGIKEGVWKGTYSDGRMVQGPIKNGKTTGTWELIDSDGNIKKQKAGFDPFL